MSMPPYMLYALRSDATGVLELLREMVPNITTTEDGGVWREVAGVWNEAGRQKPLRIRVTHRPEEYGDRAAFTRQLAGLANCVSQFPGAEEKPKVFACIRAVQFALSIVLDPPPEDTDPRLEVLATIAEKTNGFYFLPYALLDKCGRIILSTDGENDRRAAIC